MKRKTGTIEYHFKNNSLYDQQYVELKFGVETLVSYEEYKYPNPSKLANTFNSPYKIVSKLSHGNCKIDSPNYHIGSNSEKSPCLQITFL